MVTDLRGTLRALADEALARSEAFDRSEQALLDRARDAVSRVAAAGVTAPGP
jgi:hypothetical protein